MALAVLATNLTPLSFAAERADAEPAAAAGVETYDARAKRDWEYTGCLWSNDNKTVIFNYKNKKDGSTQSVTVNSTAHKMKSPTCTEEGKTRYTATVYSWDALDGQMREREKTVPVPKLDHTYPATNNLWTIWEISQRRRRPIGAHGARRPKRRLSPT